jgi:hypothetical protein
VRFFGTYLFEGRRRSASDDPRVASEPWLFLNIYDGDIATVMYRPSSSATGLAFLGITPRSYFDDDSASPPCNVALEARGLASWWAVMNPNSRESERTAKEDELRGLLAPDTTPYDLDIGAQPLPNDFHHATDGVFDTASIGVEVKAARFLATLGLPLPDDLRH